MPTLPTAGQLEVLQWLRAEDCPWSIHTCHFAVDQGHVEMLRWTRENGCPWRAYTRDRAAAELGYTDDLGNVLSIANIVVGGIATSSEEYYPTLAING